MIRLPLLLTLAGLLVMASACVRPPGKEATTPARSPAQIIPPSDSKTQQTAERIQADPVAYLRKVLVRTDALDQYRLTFYRQERLGKKLREMEKINALFRKEPFSVKFVWEDPDAAYYESVYVAGQNNNKLVIRERKGALPLLPPTTRRLNPMEAVTLGRARNPITDFGLANVTQRTLLAFEDPRTAGQTTIRYQGLVNLEPQNRPAHHLWIDRPPMPDYQYTRQDFYIDAQTQLPAGTDLYLPSGELDARYRYTDVDTNVNFTDADFRLGG